MLVLSRHRDESIVFTLEDGRRILLTVVDIRGDKARLGIAAPESIIVHRAEIQERIDAGEAPLEARDSNRRVMLAQREAHPAPAAGPGGGELVVQEFVREILKAYAKTAEHMDWDTYIDPANQEWVRAVRGAIERVLSRRASPPPRPAPADFQSRVREWAVACFGEAIADDKAERCHRFLEESLELVQALGISREDCLAIVGYVYDRPAGEPWQEAGGVWLTLAALCSAVSIDMEPTGEDELARVWAKIDKIRAKQSAKPKGSPLPQAVTPRPTPAERHNLHVAAFREWQRFQDEMGDDESRPWDRPIITMCSRIADAVVAASQPPLPAAIVRCPGGKWHLFERREDADAFFEAAENRAVSEHWNVSEWTHHLASGPGAAGEKEGAS